MSERGVAAEREEPMPSGRSAGAMIRQARKAQGLHIAVLAASIKVPPQKLEALEGDRFDLLPDATFTRALAKTVCRVLKIDADPVLECLPPGPTQGLERMASGLNAPFRERSGRREPRENRWAVSPALLGAAILVIAAVVLMLAPIDWSRARHWIGRSAPASAAAAGSNDGIVESTVAPVPGAAETVPASAPAVTASGIVTESLPLAPSVPVDVASAPMVTAGTAPPASVVAAAAASLLVITASSADTWVEVLDSSGQMLISRTVLSGETVGLDGAAPLKVRIGNARATQLSFRGQPIDLKAATRDNIARLELK